MVTAFSKGSKLQEASWKIINSKKETKHKNTVSCSYCSYMHAIKWRVTF